MFDRGKYGLGKIDDCNKDALAFASTTVSFLVLLICL